MVYFMLCTKVSSVVLVPFSYAYTLYSHIMKSDENVQLIPGHVLESRHMRSRVRYKHIRSGDMPLCADSSSFPEEVRSPSENEKVETVLLEKDKKEKEITKPNYPYQDPQIVCL